MGVIALCYAVFQSMISCSSLEIFTIKTRSCPKSRRNDVFGPPFFTKFLTQFYKSGSPSNVCWRSAQRPPRLGGKKMRRRALPFIHALHAASRAHDEQLILYLRKFTHSGNITVTSRINRCLSVIVYFCFVFFIVLLWFFFVVLGDRHTLFYKHSTNSGWPTYNL